MLCLIKNIIILYYYNGNNINVFESIKCVIKYYEINSLRSILKNRTTISIYNDYLSNKWFRYICCNIYIMLEINKIVKSNIDAHHSEETSSMTILIQRDSQSHQQY